MDGWMEALAYKVHKQEEHNSTILLHFAQAPHISSSDTLGGTVSIPTATYVGGLVRNVAILWNCALLVHVLCKPVPPSIYPSLHLVDIF